jgi:hypothetical protein
MQQAEPAPAPRRRSDDIDLYMRYLGALAVLCECSVHVPHDLRDSIEAALDDAVQHHPLRVCRVLNRFEIEPDPA